MNLPKEILNKLEELSYGQNKNEIAKNFRKISDKYIGEKNGESLLNKGDEALAYAISRMPATYSAVKTACEQMEKTLSLANDGYLKNLKTLIDVGAGTGAATLALNEFINFEEIQCLEREEVMISLGQQLLESSDNSNGNSAVWSKFDISYEELNKASDVVVTSYMLNEFSDEKVLSVVDKLWNMTKKLLIIVDSGTPNDHKRLIKIKNHLYKNGGKIVAPCTINEGCGLPENDWCHFSCRVERTKLHKEVKSADVPYEDEKFTYLIVAKDESLAQIENVNRVIRHPIINTNMVKAKLCSNGEIIEKIYTKKDKELYKKVKKAKVGDLV